MRLNDSLIFQSQTWLLHMHFPHPPIPFNLHNKKKVSSGISLEDIYTHFSCSHLCFDYIDQCRPYFLLANYLLNLPDVCASSSVHLENGLACSSEKLKKNCLNLSEWFSCKTLGVCYTRRSNGIEGDISY